MVLKSQYKQEFDQMAYLEKISSYHRLFYGVFELGNPVHMEQISTAAVAFNTDTGKIDFLINPDFFYKLGEKEQLFVICHEAMHVIFSHIERTKKFKLDGELSNIAQDIVINELLVSEFGFNRQELKFPFDLCFINTIFNEETINKNNIRGGESFEYYYNLLVDNKKKLQKGAKTLDKHDINGGGKKHYKGKGNDESGELPLKYEEIPDAVSEAITKTAAQGLSDEEKEELEEKMENALSDLPEKQAGIGAVGSLFGITLDKIKEKNPWEKIVKKKIASLLKIDQRDLESFLQKPRRLTILDKNMFLPEFLEEEKKKNDKFNIMFFLDSSGSCIGYKNQFFNLANSIPQDKFNIHLYSFDTRVYKLDLKNPSVRGGGGTSFGILETAVKNAIKTEVDFKGKHPDLVFVLTDGYGTSIKPDQPDKWYWLMTSQYYSCIPNGSNIISLKKFKNKEVEVVQKGKRSIR